MQVISLRKKQIEKQYINFYKDLNNYNMSLRMVGTAPVTLFDLKQSKTS